MEEDKIQESLQDCEEKLRHLEEENRQLRQASRVLGELADRLTSTLREERRMAAADRRLRPRRYPERRQRTVQALTHTAND